MKLQGIGSKNKRLVFTSQFQGKLVKLKGIMMSVSWSQLLAVPSTSQCLTCTQHSKIIDGTTNYSKEKRFPLLFSPVFLVCKASLLNIQHFSKNSWLTSAYLDVVGCFQRRIVVP